MLRLKLIHVNCWGARGILRPEWWIYLNPIFCKVSIRTFHCIHLHIYFHSINKVHAFSICISGSREAPAAYRPSILYMMTSSNGKICRVTGPLWGEFSGHRWIPLTNGQWRGALVFSLICAWADGWANHRHAGDLRRHRAHFDVTVMMFPLRVKTPL